MGRLQVVGIIMLAVVHYSAATTCDSCHTTYSTAIGSATTDTAKCSAMQALFTCLDTSLKTDAGCPLTAARITAINAVISGLTATCAKFVKSCKCQKEFWLTDMTAGDAAICSAGKTYILCVKASPTDPCDAVGPSTTLATSIETRLNALGSACTLTSSCKCEISRAKASVATSADMCTAYSAEIGCLGVTNTAGCDSTKTRYAIAAATNTELKALTGPACTPNPTCQCEINLAAADNRDKTKICAAITTASTCLNAITTSTAGCTGCTTTDVLKGFVSQTKMACSGVSGNFVTPTMMIGALIVGLATKFF